MMPGLDGSQESIFSFFWIKIVLNVKIIICEAWKISSWGFSAIFQRNLSAGVIFRVFLMEKCPFSQQCLWKNHEFMWKSCPFALFMILNQIIGIWAYIRGLRDIFRGFWWKFWAFFEYLLKFSPRKWSVSGMSDNMKFGNIKWAYLKK